MTDNPYITVYSTEKGRICPRCQKPIVNCKCSKKSETKGSGNVRIIRSVKGRKGRVVTEITQLPLVGEELKRLAKKLKQKCGSGGTIKDGVIEIQGDHRQLLLKELIKLGYKAKISGG